MVDLSVPEMMFGTGESFDYATCRACGSLYLDAIPEDLGRYYVENYYSIDFDPEQVLGRPGVRQAVAAAGRSAVLGRGGGCGVPYAPSPTRPRGP